MPQTFGTVSPVGSTDVDLSFGLNTLGSLTTVLPESIDEDLGKIKPILKKRHLTIEERRIFHKPNPDWVQTPSGEVCRSACTLVVDDLVESV